MSEHQAFRASLLVFHPLFFINVMGDAAFFAKPATKCVISFSTYETDQENLSVPYTSAFSLRV
jgi:hypothetical protein